MTSGKQRGLSIIHILGLLFLVGIVALFVVAETDSQRLERLRTGGKTSDKDVPNKSGVTPNPSPPTSQALGRQELPIATDSALISDIEKRLQTNEKSLQKYYGTQDQLRQSAKDIVQLAILKVDYGAALKPEEKALGKRAAVVGQKVDIQARQIYASTLEEAFVKSTIDAKVITQGLDKKTLRVTYVLLSQPIIYKFQNELKLGEQAKTFGFTRIVYSNGFEGDIGKTWTIKLDD